ncbi:MAG TPA: hypothetical protein VMU02_08615 [bacterium]|nr:hypothetical protein [bacterium]
MGPKVSTASVIGLVAIGAILAFVVGCSDNTQSPKVNLTARFTVAPAAGTVLTDFVFDASTSTASTGTLEYRWDWENDGTWDTDWSTSPTARRRFSDVEGDRIDTLGVALNVRTGSKSAIATTQIVVDARHGTVLTMLPLNAVILHPTALTADTLHIWVADWGAPGTRRIYKLDPATADTISSILSPDLRPCGIAWDGAYIATAGYMHLRKQDPSSGTVATSFDVVYCGHGAGLAWDGSTFYFPSDATEDLTEGDGLVHKYSASGTELGSFQSPRGSLHPTSIAFDGVNLVGTVEERDSFYFFDREDGTIERVVPAPAAGRRMTVFRGYIWAIISVSNLALGQIVP